MNVFKRRMVALLVFLMTMSSTCAWGRLGHRVSATIAQAGLTPEALDAVRRLLGARMTLAGISDWADSYRGENGSAAWHYVNVPITESRYHSRYCPPADAW
jgi:hypothetical protein